MTCYLNISDRAQFGQLCLTISYNSVQCSSVIESLISQLPGGKSLGGGGEHLEGKLLEACSCKEWHFVFFPSLYVKCG